MNKKVFLRELEFKLKRLPREDREDAIRYYEEYFQDAEIEDGVDVTSKLGSPSEVASQILSEHAVKELNENPKSIKKGISSMWFILLAILISPLAFPIALPIFILGFVALILIVVFSFVFVVVVGSLFFSGFTVIFSGFSLVFSNFTTAIGTIGVGLIMIGLMSLLLIGVGFVVCKLFRITVEFISSKINKG